VPASDTVSIDACPVTATAANTTASTPGKISNMAVRSSNVDIDPTLKADVDVDVDVEGSPDSDDYIVVRTQNVGISPSSLSQVSSALSSSSSSAVTATNISASNRISLLDYLNVNFYI